MADNMTRDTQPEQVGVDALKLLDDIPDVLRPAGDLNAGDVLDAAAVGPGVGVRADAADALHQRNGLDEIALLAQLFNAAVVVADKNLGIGDALAVHDQLGMDGLLKRGMVGADGNCVTHGFLRKKIAACAVVHKMLTIIHQTNLFYRIFPLKSTLKRFI